MEKAVSEWPSTASQEANAYRTPRANFKAWSGKFICAIPVYRITEPTVKSDDNQLELGFY